MTFRGMTLEPFRTYVLNNDRVLDALWTSIVVSLIAVVITIPIGYFCALGLLSRTSTPRGVRVIIDGLVLLPIAMPAAVIGLAVLFAYSSAPFHLYGTRAVIVLTYVTLMIPYAMRSQHSSLIALGNAQIEASITAGAGPTRTTLLVVLPSIRRGVAAGAAVMIVLLFHEFSASLMVRSPSTHVLGSILYDYWIQGSNPAIATLSLTMIAVTIFGVSLALALGGRKALENI